MVAEENDKELVRRAKSGDHQAFAQLVEENQNRVYSLAFRITGDREESADLAQEAFLKAWQALPNFQGESSFATWVYRLTTNLCIDYIRRQQRRRETVSAVSLDDSDSPFPEPADPGQDPHRALEQAELRRAVERGLGHIASLGVEDYTNEFFTRYSARLFPFQEVRAEMAHLQGKGPGGKANLRTFLDGLLVLTDED